MVPPKQPRHLGSQPPNRPTALFPRALELLQYLVYQIPDYEPTQAAEDPMPSSPKITPATLHILLTLARGARHGYSIMQEIEDRTAGRIRLGPSSLYWSLSRLEKKGLIEETGPPTDEPSTDDRRRYYRLTEAGEAGLTMELGTLQEIVDHAQAQNIPTRRGA